MTLVGVYVALCKPLVAVIPVFLLAWMRFGIAALAMASWIKKPADEAPIDRRTRVFLFLESFLGNFLFSICMLYGISMTSTVSAGVILSAIPATSALMGWYFLKEKMNGRMWLSVALAATGLALLTLAKAPPHSPDAASTEAPVNMLLGNLLVFGAVLCESAFVVIGKRLSATISPKRIAAIINLHGFALSTPMGLYIAWQFDFGTVSLTAWGLMVF